MQERIIDKVLNTEVKIKSISLKGIDLIFCLCLFVFAFMVRWKLMPIESADFYGFLEEWMQRIRDNDGFWSLSMEISNYTSPYMYIMTLLSYISTNDLYALKLVSVFFDYMAAIAVFLIVMEMSGSVRKSILGMAAILLSPTVIIDSAYWCQCDIIYTCFLLYSFYFFLRNQSEKAMLFYAVSFAFKLQSLFLLPFYIIMWLKKKTIQLRHMLWIPVIYFISVIPAWVAGRSLRELFSIYLNQTDTYPWGTLEYPNIYALLGEAMPDMRHAAEVSGAGMYTTIMLLGCIAYYIYNKNVMLTQELLVTLALFMVAVTVYGLPHMHDRYGFLIDLFAIIYGVCRVRKLPITLGFQLVSILTFMPYLIAVHIVPIQYVAILQFVLIACVGWDLYRQVQENILSEYKNPIL